MNAKNECNEYIQNQDVANIATKLIIDKRIGKIK